MWESKYKFPSEGQAPGLWDKWEEAQDVNDLSTCPENRNIRDLGCPDQGGLAPALPITPAIPGDR